MRKETAPSHVKSSPISFLVFKSIASSKSGKRHTTYSWKNTPKKRKICLKEKQTSGCRSVATIGSPLKNQVTLWLRKKSREKSMNKRYSIMPKWPNKSKDTKSSGKKISRATKAFDWSIYSNSISIFLQEYWPKDSYSLHHNSYNVNFIDIIFKMVL